MNKLSIIIPVYNGEKFIDRCLESILSQDNGKLEIILVNDGSLDKSAEICDRYASECQAVRCIHKPNGGVSSARNVGLNHATGDYIWFVDVDDEIADGAIDVIFSSTDAPITVYNFRTVANGNLSAPVLANGDYTYKIENFDDFFVKYVFAYKLSNSLWNKVYRSDIMRDNAMSFREDIRIGEDLLFNLEYSKYAKNITFSDYDIYRWYIIPGSAMHSKNTKVFEYQQKIAESVKNEYKGILSDEVLDQFLLLQLVCGINQSRERGLDKKLLKAYAKAYMTDIMGGKRFSRRVVDNFLKSEGAGVLSKIKFKICYFRFFCRSYMKIGNAYLKVCRWFLSRFCTYKVADFDETIATLLNTNKSMIRFGDGELRILLGHDIGYQKSDDTLRKRLTEVISDESDDILIALPGPLGDEYSFLTQKARDWWRESIYNEKYYWRKFTNPRRQYYNALVSRFYVGIENRDDSARFIEKIKLLWKNKKLLIIEGALTKNGVGNDLFSEAAEVKRILCPPTNAFDRYGEILDKSLKYGKKFDLILISLGPTSKVLAYDLAKAGCRAIDIGHIDNEYEWFLKGDHCRSKITGKYVNEVAGGNIADGLLEYNADEILACLDH